MIFGNLLSLTPIFKHVRGKQPHHNHGRRRQKWPPIAAHELKCQAHTRQITGEQCPDQADFFSCNKGVYCPLNAPMVRQWRQWILPHHQSILRVIDPLIARKLGASFAVNPETMHLTLELMCSNRGPFLAVAAMVMGGVVGRWPWCLCHHKPYR